MKNPKILHRIYFDNMAPYRDPFVRFLDTWKRELPDYRIMQWNASNLDLQANDWVKRAAAERAPVFLSEYFRWWVLKEHGGAYLDADCEILSGPKLAKLVDDVFSSPDYDAAIGVEDYANGHPTAQSVIAKPGSELVTFMLGLYEQSLAPLWRWREERGLIGPQLMSLYFAERGRAETKGMFWQLNEPEVCGRVRVYTQDYFSPKFTLEGTSLNFTSNTCVYHLFANLNMKFDDETREELRTNPLLFHEYRALLSSKGIESTPPRRTQEPQAKNDGPPEGTTADAQAVASSEKKQDIRKRNVVGEIARRLLPKALSPSRRALRTLHRIYFGFDGKPDALGGYLQTWQSQLPDFEVKHWDATNLPVDLNDYTKELFKAKDHAFLTDYFRWWVLREYGGTYLDADVEVVNGRLYSALIDELERSSEYDAFIGIDERHGGWYTAHSMASKPHSSLSESMCRVYEEMGPIRAWRKKAFYLWAPQLTALHFYNSGHNPDGLGTSPNLVAPQVIAGVKVYPQEFFSPIAPLKGEDGSLFSINALSDRTSLCHHFACSWHDDRSPYSEHANNFQAKKNFLLSELVEAQISAVDQRSPSAGTLVRYQANHPAIRTEVAQRTNSGLEITKVKSGTAIFGPYIDLQPGRYVARINFDPRAGFSGRAHCDVCCDGGMHTIASMKLDAAAHPRQVELRFSAPAKLPHVEVRIFCEHDFTATVTSVEFERV